MLNILAQTAPVAQPSSNTDYLTQIGVAGIVIFMVLQMVLKFLKEMKDRKERGDVGGAEPKTDTGSFPTITSQNVSDIFKGLGDIKALVHDLHMWHDVRDEDHVFAWYVRKSFSDSIIKLNKAVADLAQGVTKLNEALKNMTEED